ncbi:MAG: FAD-dependent oxidoreductase [Pyrinomonadaceae bacterium]|nr:FAD-dependent oxidoreductase [Pyrinomonadaceae bacterium]
MANDVGQSVSVWMKTEKGAGESALAENTTADVCIIGAGIAGLTTAYLLGRAGKRVVVLEDKEHVGGGQTERTTAHLANAIDDRYYEVERLFGEDGARLAAESHTRAIDEIERIVNEEKIDCDFARVDGYLFAPPDESKEELDRELEAAHRAGLKDVEKVQRAPVKDFDTGAALRFPRQGQFHITKYLNGLERAVKRQGGRVFTNTHVIELEGGEQAQVRARSGYKVTASAIVAATNSPITARVAIHSKQAPYITYSIGARVPRNSIEKALYWDTLDPYHYVRLEASDEGEREGYDILIVGGEDHKTGQANDGAERYARLERWARERFPVIESIEYRWSGQVMETIDGLAFIGRSPGEEKLFVATGDSGMGMTHGTIAGMLLTDLITGRPNAWEKIYDPSRVVVGSLGEYAKENLNVAAQYADLVTGGDVSSVDEIKPGEGAIIRQGLKKIAAYRDESGALYERSAICPHLGCVVQWNSTEKTWDCPCHGSRFDARGTVVNAPTLHDLESVSE